MQFNGAINKRSHPTTNLSFGPVVGQFRRVRSVFERTDKIAECSFVVRSGFERTDNIAL